MISSSSSSSASSLPSSAHCYVMSVGLCLLVCFHGYAQGAVPALYVFGDSLVDVGNNDYLPLSVLKANFLPNGVDYHGGQPTGRFSNGKISADIFAEKLGLPTSVPYLNISSSSNKTEEFLNGVSFASGGAGVLDSTNNGECLTLSNQIDSYSTVYQTLVDSLGSEAALNHVSKSIFILTIGSNEILTYTRQVIKPDPQGFMDSVIAKLKSQLERIYSLGARKFFFVGTGPIGCCPSQRTQNITDDCNALANELSAMYNKGAANSLSEMKSNHSDMSYTFFDTYGTVVQFIKSPAKYGFSEVKAACCGQGDLNANLPCLPSSGYCNNRTNHLFWDLFHPTEAADRLLASSAFGGAAPFVFPINVHQLSAI